jgi:hypothetical protein
MSHTLFCRTSRAGGILLASLGLVPALIAASPERSRLVVVSPPVARSLLLGASGPTIVLRESSGRVLARYSPDSPAPISITGRDGVNETLTVDLAGGGLGSNRLVRFDGGRGGFDSIRVIGNGRSRGRYIPSPTTFGDGTIIVDEARIEFVGLEPAAVEGMSEFTFETPGQWDWLGVTSDAPGTSVISGYSDGVPFESLTFRNVTHFILDMGKNDAPNWGTNDRAYVDGKGLVAEGLQSITVLGGRGRDEVIAYSGDYRLPIGGGILCDMGEHVDTVSVTSPDDGSLSATDAAVTSTGGGEVRLANLDGECIELRGGPGAGSFH